MENPEFYKNYKQHDWLRNHFFEFTPKVFSGLSFKEWYERGCWHDSYIPYSYVTGTEMIANVSISEMEILLQGEVVTVSSICDCWHPAGISQTGLVAEIDGSGSGRLWRQGRSDVSFCQ